MREKPVQLKTSVHLTLPFNTICDLLVKTISSIVDQIYPHWALTLLVGDDVDHAQLVSLLESAFDDDRIRTTRARDATEWAVIERDCTLWLPLLPGDSLSEDALAEFVLRYETSKYDVCYSDHIDSEDFLSFGLPYFKPAWSPELLICTNYVRRAIFSYRARSFVSNFPLFYDENDVWELILRGQQYGFSVDNVERVLLEQLSINPSFITQDRGARLAKYLEDHSIAGQVAYPLWAAELQLPVLDITFPNYGPSVGIIIPTKNNYQVLKRCIDSLKSTAYKNYKVFVIDNESNDPDTLKYIDSLEHDVFRISNAEEKFSYSYINNTAVERVDTDLVLFLNDDTEVIQPNWLSVLVGWTQFPNVGSVGARLLFPNGTIQHAGLVNRADGLFPAPAFKLLPRDAIGQYGYDRITRNCSAVTAACMLTPRKLFLEIGRFDDNEFQVAYNDCDYGFRLTKAGLRNVYCPYAQLYHHEGVTRGRGRGNDAISEESACIRKYGTWRDPYYNSNLDLQGANFEIGCRSISNLIERDATVVLVTHNLNYEGAPLVLLDIAKGLVRSGTYKVIVVSLIDGPLREEYEVLGIRVIVQAELGIFGTVNAKDLSDLTDYFSQLLKQLHCRLVVANTVITHWAIDAATTADIPSLWVIHESEPPFTHLEPHGRHHVDVAHKCFGQTYMNVFVSEATRSIYRLIETRNNSLVIYNGFDREGTDEQTNTSKRKSLRKELGIIDGELMVILPGTVCERKSQIDLVKAIPLIARPLVEKTIFYIVGDRLGPYSSALHLEISKLPSSYRERVRVVPETSQIHRYYKASDVMAFTSKLESLPRVIMEAMHYALPIVTTPVFGIKELVTDKKSALFYDQGDVHQLASRLEQVLSDASLRRTLGSNANKALGKFPTMSEMQNAYVSLVAEAIVSGAPRGVDNSVPAWLES